MKDWALKNTSAQLKKFCYLQTMSEVKSVIPAKLVLAKLVLAKAASGERETRVLRSIPLDPRVHENDKLETL